MALALALAAVPVWRLTRHEEAAAAPAAPAGKKSERWLDVELISSAPGHLSLSSLGKPLLESGPAETAAKGRILISGKSDLVASADWGDSAGNQALRVMLSDGGTTVTDVTFWGKGSVEDVLP
jgi:hypothetical protein